MKRLLDRIFLGLLLAVLATAVQAQGTSVLIVSSCGTPPFTYTAGQIQPLTMDTTGKLCTGAAVTPGGTQDINLKQIQGAVPSTLNPVWVAPAAGITPTDHTITSATGSSQTIMAANPSRHSLTIVNTGNANCGINPTGGTATIAGASTLTLAPLGAYTPRIPTLSAVTAICTSGQPLYADEN